MVYITETTHSLYKGLTKAQQKNVAPFVKVLQSGACNLLFLDAKRFHEGIIYNDNMIDIMLCDD